MIYILDTADLAAIKHCNEFYPLAGVTTNPSIIAKAKTDFWPLVENIRAIIGKDKMLHVQTTETKAEAIVEEAKLLQERLGGEFYVKIPIGEEGLKATMMLKEIGINVDIQVIEWGTYLQKTAEGLPLFLLGWTTVTADADNGLYANFHSSAWGSQGNRSFYKNEKVDELLDGGRAEFDQEKRKAMYQEACQIIYDDAGWDFLAAELYNLGMRENVQGFVPMSTTFFDLSTVYFQ